MKLKRIVKRTTEEIVATKKIAKVTSFSKAVNTFIAKIDIQKMVRNGYRESSSAKKRLVKKHNTMMEYFEKTFSEYLSSYDFDRPILEGNPDYSHNIWICWWQGLENAPEIVKACVNSIRKNAGNHPVVIITEENYKEYVHIPEWVEEKKKQGIISRTHMSDILRLSLLAEHGGLWLDATLFCIKPEIESYFEFPIWSIKRPDYLHCSVAQGYFATYSLHCAYEKRWIFATIRDFFLHYWETNDNLIDYLTQDYMIVLAQRHDVRIAEAFSQIVVNNPRCDDLCTLLGESFNSDIWEDLSKDTALFKLTWKTSFSDSGTFYQKLIEGVLIKE
ncbi:MAG: capsular polysaccharide synthesis protein [Candidatus Coproplasma sp.]